MQHSFSIEICLWKLKLLCKSVVVLNVALQLLVSICNGAIRADLNIVVFFLKQTVALIGGFAHHERIEKNMVLAAY